MSSISKILAVDMADGIFTSQSHLRSNFVLFEGGEGGLVLVRSLQEEDANLM